MKPFLPVLLTASACLFADPATDACALLRGQKQEEAFRSFLKALDQPVANEEAAPENVTYSEALELYLNPGKAPADAAARIIENYSESEDKGVAYLLAVAYANKGDYERFFNYFWKAYRNNPDHYLAFKARAVLHIKLLERSPTPELREAEKREVFRFSKMALEREPRDHSLYKLTLAFCPESERQEHLKANLNKIITNNIVTPRADIKFYVQQAAAAKEYGLADQYLEKAREWYRFSRAIEAAKEYLDRERAA